MKKLTKKGFTLVELVIVIAVLVILAAIAIPTVTGVINNANASTDASNAKAIESAIKLQIVELEKPASTAVDTVGAALTNSGLQLTDLTCKQKDFAFYYNGTTNVVTASKTAVTGAVQITSANAGTIKATDGTTTGA